MASLLSSLMGRSKRRSVAPTETLGAMGTAVYGGFVQDNEKSGDLKGQERYRTFSEVLANTSIVAAGTRYFLNLIAKAEWKFEPAEADTDGHFADLAEQMLTDDPATTWTRIIRRAAMYRFYGFSVQEWTARRRDDGHLTYADVAPRAQLTVERWDIAEAGHVLGVVQRSPQTGQEIYLPREKLMYVVDDTLSDSPEGLGLFRHIVEPSRRLKRYEQLEGFGFETDLRGIPVGRGPFTELATMVEAGEITAAERTRLEAPIRDFIKNHVRNPKLGILLDSMTYQTTDERQSPSSVYQWDMDILKGGSTSFAENAAAIDRINKEIARILGVEGLLLGSDGSGSLALSKEKSNQLFLVVDGTMQELKESVRDDLIAPLWRLNGWPEETMPWPKAESVQFKDVEQITGALRDMAQAGAVLDEDDPAIGEVRDILGLSRPPERTLDNARDAAVRRPSEGTPESDDDMPDDPARTRGQE